LQGISDQSATLLENLLQIIASECKLSKVCKRLLTPVKFIKTAAHRLLRDLIRLPATNRNNDELEIVTGAVVRFPQQEVVMGQ
jgi:hypothetical protein